MNYEQIQLFINKIQCLISVIVLKCSNVSFLQILSVYTL